MGTRVHEITLKGHYRERLGRILKLAFKPGVNLLVGPNGSGKSTVIQALWSLTSQGRDTSATELKKSLRVKIDAGGVRCLDFERDNPRTKSFGHEVIMGNLETASWIHAAVRLSHGEATRKMLQPITSKEVKGVLLLLDEPEQALDLTGQKMLANGLHASPASQILVATHSPLLLLDRRFHAVELVPKYLTTFRETVRTLLEGAT